jgi:hypothetical protein
MRQLLVVTICILLVGCGGGGSASSPAAPPLGLQRAERARACLSEAGFRVVGGPKPSGDRNAPDVELIVSGNGGGPGAFLAFYEEVERAKRLESDLRRNAQRFDGSLQRRGSVSIVWVGNLSADDRRRIEGCAF